MVNVNISKDAWRKINNYKEPGETFAQALDRLIYFNVPAKYIHENGKKQGPLGEVKEDHP